MEKLDIKLHFFSTEEHQKIIFLYDTIICRDVGSEINGRKQNYIRRKRIRIKMCRR